MRSSVTSLLAIAFHLIQQILSKPRRFPIYTWAMAGRLRQWIIGLNSFFEINFPRRRHFGRRTAPRAAPSKSWKLLIPHPHSYIKSLRSRIERVIWQSVPSVLPVKINWRHPPCVIQPRRCYLLGSRNFMATGKAKTTGKSSHSHCQSHLTLAEWIHELNSFRDTTLRQRDTFWMKCSLRNLQRKSGIFRL